MRTRVEHVGDLMVHGVQWAALSVCIFAGVAGLFLLGEWIYTGEPRKLLFGILDLALCAVWYLAYRFWRDVNN